MTELEEIPKSLQGLMIALSRALVGQGVKASIAAKAVGVAVLEWQELNAGISFNVPLMTRAKRKDMNRAILAEFEAHPENSIELCRKYGISRRRLYIIAAEEREKRAGEVERKRGHGQPV